MKFGLKPNLNPENLVQRLISVQFAATNCMLATAYIAESRDCVRRLLFVHAFQNFCEVTVQDKKNINKPNVGKLLKGPINHLPKTQP